jgi:tetratricopeptide (TPR) repeat protein
MHNCSILKQERLNRGWSYDTVEEKTGIPQRSQENAENGYHFPRQPYIDAYSNLYGKSPRELGLDKSDRIGVEHTNAPTSQEENATMSDLIRRSALSDLGSYLTGLVSMWPRRNRHYAELQEGISKAIIDHSTLIGKDPISALNRRQALMSLGLVPIRLSGRLPITDAKKVDTDTLLAHCAAGITACWYLRRGKDLIFVSDLISSYISILQPLIYSLSEAYRKASATLLSESFRLKSKLADALQYDDQAVAYEEEAIRYALMAENSTEQAIANRQMAMLHWEREKYEQALPYAEKAYGLTAKNTSKTIRSFTASGLSICQAATGYSDDAQISLAEALDLFDPSVPVTSIAYGEAILTAVAAAAKQHSGAWSESVQLYEKSLIVPDISALGSVSQRINYATTEVSRDDIQTRNMDLCITLLTESITGAKELDSKLFIRKARECCNLLRAAWPRETEVKKLFELF